MPSPFPGMDPYVERQWKTFHGLMIGAMVSGLNAALPAGLVAQMEAEVRVESIDGEPRYGYEPDVVMVERDFAPSPTPRGGVAMAEPIRLAYKRGPIVQRSIQIVDPANGKRIVTAIELLSPWNKRAGRLNRDYRRKLRDYQESGTSWIEIDLHRSPRRRLSVTWDVIPADRRERYLVVRHRAVDADLSAYPISLREKMRAIPVPLRPGDVEVALDLQSAFERAYADGFARSIDYSIPPDPPLSPADAEWAAGLLAQRNSGQ